MGRRSHDLTRYALALFWRDVTEQHEINEKLRETTRRLNAVLDNASVAIFLMDDRQHCAYMNSAAEALTGYSLAETQGRPLHDVVHHSYPDGRPFLISECAIDRAFPENAHTSGEEVFVHKDGGFYPVAFVASPIRDDASKTIGTIIEVRDIREERAAAEALVRLNAELETRVDERTATLAQTAKALEAEMARREVMQSQLVQAQKMEALGQLVGGVAHDFNNVLAAIQGAFMLVERRVVEDDAKFVVAEGLKASGRASALVKQMLAFARRETVQPRVIDLKLHLPGLREMLSHAVGAIVDCQVRVERDLHPVLADPQQLEVALLNLAINARDAMPAGGNLEIIARNLAADASRPAALGSGDAVAIAVRDTGSGMDAATAERALEPFFTTKGLGKGTGLGLAQVHGLVARASGAMTIESEPGQGTVVTLYLPRAAVTSHAVEDDTKPVLPRGETTVLLVDDDQVRPITAAYLREIGHSVVEAADAAIALAMAELHAVDVLVTDVVMPDIDGPTLVKQMRARRPGLPVVYVTGFADDRPLVEGQMVAKPFSGDELASAIWEATSS
jgi:PAS domain S-box-containing protein